MILVFSSFLLAGRLDAFILRTVPAVMHVSGDRNWWLPRGLDRALPRGGGGRRALGVRRPPRRRSRGAGAPRPRQCCSSPGSAAGSGRRPAGWTPGATAIRLTS